MDKPRFSLRTARTTPQWPEARAARTSALPTYSFDPSITQGVAAASWQRAPTQSVSEPSKKPRLLSRRPPRGAYARVHQFRGHHLHFAWSSVVVSSRGAIPAMCASHRGKVPNFRPGPGKGYSYCEFCGTRFSSRKRYCPACLQDRPARRCGTGARATSRNRRPVTAARPLGSVPVRARRPGADQHGDVRGTHHQSSGAAVTLPTSAPIMPYMGQLQGLAAATEPAVPAPHCYGATHAPSPAHWWGMVRGHLRLSAPGQGAPTAVPTYYPWHWPPSGPHLWPTAHGATGAQLPQRAAPHIAAPAPGWVAVDQGLQVPLSGPSADPSPPAGTPAPLIPAPPPPVASPVSPPRDPLLEGGRGSAADHAPASSQPASAAEAQALLVLAHTALEVAAQDDMPPALPRRPPGTGSASSE